MASAVVGDALSDAYPWIKALHILAVISWMVGLLYLPRLFVYHADVAPGSDGDSIFQVMERRLLRGIMLPASIAVWLLGGLLLAVPGLADWESGWLYVKLFLVALLTAFHHVLAHWRKSFVAGENRRSARFYRMVNEVPTVLMIGIVVMVVVRPF